MLAIFYFCPSSATCTTTDVNIVHFFCVHLLQERVEAKQKEKLAKQKERSRKNVRTASHHVEKSSGRVETIAQENGRQSSASTSEPAPASVDVSSGRKQKPASARPTNRR